MFGSRARGETGAESDLDLIIEMDKDLRRLAVDWLFGLRDWPMDIVVYTPEELKQRRDTVYEAS